MDEDNRKIYISGAQADGDFNLEDILAEYRAGLDEPVEPDWDSLADRSKRIVMDSISDEYGSTGISSLDDVIETAVAEVLPEPEPEPEPDSSFSPLPAPQPEPEPEPEEEELSPEQEALIAVLEAEAERVQSEELSDDDGATEYASDLTYGEEESEPEPREDAETGRERKPKEAKGSTKERFLSPVVALLALIALRRGQKESREQEKAVPAAQERPEPEPGRAARRCAALMNGLRFRGRVASALSLIMIYVSYAAGSALPLTGALKSSPRAQALLLMILELSVMMAGLDVFTEGVLSVFRKKPTARSLVSASCLFSLLDAIVIAAGNSGAQGMPFCAVSAVSLTFALWGEFCGCAGNRTGYRVLTSSKNLYTVTGEKGLASGDVALMKSRRGIQGFVRRSEDADFGEQVFGIAAPLLMIASVVLGALASLGHGAPKNILHDISAMSAASAAFSATLCFTVPYAVAARCLSRSGAAVAGWGGVKDIGTSRHVIITDGDLFPKGTVTVGNIRVLEGAFVDKVISCTGSVMAASGSGLAEPFADLIRRNGYTLSRVENFEPHDGGGVTAVVNGDTVCVGSTGFMNLMGIRVPRKLTTKNSVFTAINGSLVGIFTVDYRATGSVQEALVTLLHSNLEPVFAIRDFNITPQMIKTKFRMPTDGFKFPAYAERYRISGAQPDQDSRVAAALAREGMAPLVDTAERGRRLYNGVRAGALIAAVGGLFGLLLMFLLCWTGSFDSATAGNMITFMLLWLIPTAVIVWGIQR